MHNLAGKRAYIGQAKKLIYTFFINILHIVPPTIPNKPNVAKFLTAFLIALECFYGTNYGFDINIIGNVYGVIWSSAYIICGLRSYALGVRFPCGGACIICYFNLIKLN